MSSKGNITLLNFFVFNSTYGPREGEEDKKIMYFYPPNTDIDTKIKKIGLCEAVVKFTETFSDKPCESVHTQKTRQIYFEPEKEFWVVMTVSIPYVEKSKDGSQYLEYHEEDVQDRVYKAILQQAYRMFQFFNGTFYDVLTCNDNDVKVLQKRLDHFYSRDSLLFLLLLRSGLDQDDMRIMYKYLTTSLFPTYLEQELQGGSVTSPARMTATHAGVHYGNSSDPLYRYIYFNHMNLAQKTTVHVDNKKSNVNIPVETLRLLSDISSDMSKNCEDGETIVKTVSDSWIVGKKSDEREFYVVINQKNSNLIEINDEVKKLCATNFNSIFFLD
ncbi:hypothetical protein KUTeg_002947 [Tegillarca granosa]|uniref:Vacuolar fusion protein CCZ1 homolog n=1 Tax=Tegillarca granosa TaxID=220873 RepID=A0ABQ9FKN1_TEGGR|nr:hypothetical protein KUTeg_002947 [Tegillarca granosa]